MLKDQKVVKDLRDKKDKVIQDLKEIKESPDPKVKVSEDIWPFGQPVQASADSQ